MAKRIFTLSILLGTALFIVGCGTPKTTEQRVGDALSELACLSLETNNSFTADQIDEIAVKNDFVSGQEFINYVAHLNEKDDAVAKAEAMFVINSKCGQGFTNIDVIPLTRVEEIISNLVGTDTTVTE
ncbi:MAG: hypothetical protein WCW30_01080 [Candidatus Gracilibacteria bacterium]